MDAATETKVKPKETQVQDIKFAGSHKCGGASVSQPETKGGTTRTGEKVKGKQKPQAEGTAKKIDAPKQEKTKKASKR